MRAVGDGGRGTVGARRAHLHLTLQARHARECRPLCPMDISRVNFLVTTYLSLICGEVLDYPLPSIPKSHASYIII